MNKRKILFLIVIAVISVTATFFKKDNTEKMPVPNDENSLIVRYIDVGQGDCELITFPDGRNMLIDAGTTASEDTLPEYLNSLGIKRLDYVIGTHPHEDHIGGLDAVIADFEIGEIYMPKATATTKTYKDVLKNIQKKNLTVNTAKSGKIIIDETSLKAELLAPINDEYESLNDYSAVLKLQYGETSFLFTGDAEKVSENEMIKSPSASKLKCDVLKVGHHGSSTSTSENFLKAVSPTYAVISCAKDNDYGHPHRETVSILDEYKIETYRTDISGTITVVSDGKDITFTTEK